MPNKNGLILITPTSVDKTGTGSTATVSANGSVEFSSCATLSLNGVFSADYDNYMVVCRGVSTGFGGTLDARMRLNGTDSTATTDYNHQELLASSTSVTTERVTTRGAWVFTRINPTVRSGFTSWIYGPNLAQPTAFRTTAVDGGSSATLFDYAGTHELSTAYDGITFIMQSPETVSGRVAVYGMRK